MLKLKAEMIFLKSSDLEEDDLNNQCFHFCRNLIGQFSDENNNAVFSFKKIFSNLYKLNEKMIKMDILERLLH